VIWLLDRYEAKPGRLRELQAAFESEYLPGALRRGLTLVGRWVSPPVELEQGANELLLLWSLPDREAFWKMRIASGADPDVHAWWRKADAWVLRRERQFLDSPEALA
jgi:hypothetical protein